MIRSTSLLRFKFLQIMGIQKNGMILTIPGRITKFKILIQFFLPFVIVSQTATDIFSLQLKYVNE